MNVIDPAGVPAGDPTVEPTVNVEPSEPVEPAVPAEPTEPVSPVPAKRGGYQRKISKLEQETARLRAELDKLKPVEKAIEKPKQDDFEDFDTYIEALTDWKIQRTLAGVNVARELESAQHVETTKVSAFKAAVEVFAATKPDFHDVIDGVADVIIPEALRNTIIESQFGPELIYTMAKDADELDRVLDMTPVQQIKYVGVLEKELAGKKKKPAAAVANLPKPIEPVTPGATPAINPATAPTLAEYRKLRAQS